MPYLKTMTTDLLDMCEEVTHLSMVNGLVYNDLVIAVERKVLAKVTEFNFKLIRREVEIAFTLRSMDGPFSVFGITVKLGTVKHVCYIIGGTFHSPTLEPDLLEQVSITTKYLVTVALEKPWSI